MQRGREHEREKWLVSLVGGTAEKERRGPPTVAARGLKEVF